MEQKSTAVRIPKSISGDSLADYFHVIAPEDRHEISRSRLLKRSLHSDSYLDRWLSKHLQAPSLKTATISLKEMSRWIIADETGNICHESDRFFSIIGISVKHRTNSGEIEWNQPIIEQPEIGILGLITKKINGVLHFCLQAKEEPGNISSVQLSPTVQATYSNYTKAHGGVAPKFVNYFTDSSKGRIIFAKLQTEDGGRFLYKSNRNMIVKVENSELEYIPEGYIWLTLRQISRLLQRKNLVNACTRSILSALLFPEYGYGKQHTAQLNPSEFRKTSQWIDEQKTSNHFLTKRKPLNTLSEWSMDFDGSFSHNEGRFFRVIGIEVESTHREIGCWSQPILESLGTGIIGLLTKYEKRERYFLMQAKAEPGNRSLVQIGPTVQFTSCNYIGNNKLAKPFLYDEFSQPGFPILHDSLQSEEGARFYKESHRHRILSLPEGTPLDLPPEYMWISQSLILFLISMGETVNSCARSVLSTILSIDVET